VRDVIHFVHGNGFPSPCYRELLRRLSDRFECCYLDRVGHDPEYPVTDNWQHLVEEVIVSIQRQTSKPVIALGHSLGGVLSLLASIQQPLLFNAVIMLDSPMLGRMKSMVLRASKSLGMIDHLTPALQTRKRRKHWETREQVLAYLRRRTLFKSFAEPCLQDYVNYGMDINEQGYTLRFDPSIETQIYRTIPHESYANEGKLNVPSALLYGDRSHLIRRPELHYMKNKYGIRCYKISGTHMFPMEDPDACAQLVMKIIDVLVK
jgi:pimeloyl-ACP methyl ester carboxylesterase